ncbi:hypothetical protein ACFX12_003505 [Malus domestica]
MAVLNRVLRSQQPGSFFSLRSFRSSSSRSGASAPLLLASELPFLVFIGNNKSMENSTATMRSICLRDMGTYMTPTASQKPSRTTTPIRATTPAARSLISSGSFTPVWPYQHGRQGAHQGYQVSTDGGRSSHDQTSPCGRRSSTAKRYAEESNACKNLSENLSSDQGTMEEVFTDFKGFRVGLIKALTTDVEQVHPELPELALGTNFARDGMQERDWLSLVAVHSDSWLLSVAFYFSARFGFDKIESAETKTERDVRWKSEKKKQKQVCR